MKTLSILGIIGGSIVIALMIFVAGVQAGYRQGAVDTALKNMHLIADSEMRRPQAWPPPPLPPAPPALPSGYRCVGRDLIHQYTDNGVPTIAQVAVNSSICR